jgi:hypothetical protein
MSYPDIPPLHTSGMTIFAAALQPVSGPDLETLRPLLTAVGGSAVRLAPPHRAAGLGPNADAHRGALRNVDLVAGLRRARAARFADRYEWLALRRRRAQIAARHALEG